MWKWNCAFVRGDNNGTTGMLMARLLVPTHENRNSCMMYKVVTNTAEKCSSHFSHTTSSHDDQRGIFLLRRTENCFTYFTRSLLDMPAYLKIDKMIN